MKPHFRVSLGLALLALTAIQSLAQSVYTPYTFTTFAGLAGNSGSADGMGSVARVSYPQAVAGGSAGKVFVAGFGNLTIRKMKPAGEGGKAGRTARREESAVGAAVEETNV